MKILAVDTTAKAASVALTDGTKILSSAFTNTGLTHSQTLLPMIDRVLKGANKTIGEIDCFAINNGPGSFTGVRIGVAAVKGLAQIASKPCVPVSTLESLAFNLIDCDCTAVSVMDARCNQVYCGIFEIRNGEISRLTGDEALLIPELEDKLKGFENIYFVGDGAMLCYEYYKEKISCRPAGESLRYENAQSTALLAYTKAQRGETVTAGELMPLYLRLPQAERELKKKLEKEKS